MSPISPHPFILVDGSSYLFRAFHALPPLMTSKGHPTGACYGVMNMIRKLMKDYEPTYMAVVFDPKGRTFRDDIYPLYKAHRPPMADELSCQIGPLFDMIKAQGIPLIIIDGYEADDVIGTLTKSAMQHNLPTLISTGDKDLAQLVNPNVTLINTMSNTILDEAGVEAKFGVPPHLIIDYLALIGDNVDNIPGIPKVGPKTAQKWLHEFGSAQGIIDAAHQIKGAVGDSLRQHLDNIPLAKKLITLKDDIDLGISPISLTLQPKSHAVLLELFKEYEFKSWLSELLKSDENTPPPSISDYQPLLTKPAFEAWMQQLAEVKIFALNIETTSLNYIDANIVGVSFAANLNTAAYVPFEHDNELTLTQLDKTYVLAHLKTLLEDPHIIKIGHNLKFIISVLTNHHISLQGLGFDTSLEAYVLASTSRLDLNTLALKYLGHQKTLLESIAGKGSKQQSFNQIPIAQATQYAAEKAQIILQLHDKLWPQLEKDPALQRVFQNIEMPLVEVLSAIERTGVLIDAPKLQSQSNEMQQRITKIEEEVYATSGVVFNLSSTKQLQEVLYTRLGLPILQKTPGGQPSTAEAVLQELAHDFSLPKLILEHRSLCKLKSTYTDSLPLQVYAKTGRVHTSYNQAGAATGRFSSSDPNLQNIPIRTPEGRKIRQAFIAPPHYKILAADYSQIELRIMAHLSADQGLVNAFNQGLDIHSATASEVFGIPLDKLTANERRSAKAINFGLIYGMSSFGLAKQLAISRYDAENYIRLYFSRYPGVKKYMDKIQHQAQQQGYVETLFGRRLYVPEITSKNLQRQKAALRIAINAPMQGTAADIIKIAMVKVYHAIAQFNGKVKMIMQVHDELVFEVEETLLEPAKKTIQSEMANAAALAIPLVVDIGIGNNWDEAH